LITKKDWRKRKHDQLDFFNKLGFIEYTEKVKKLPEEAK